MDENVVENISEKPENPIPPKNRILMDARQILTRQILKRSYVLISLFFPDTIGSDKEGKESSSFIVSLLWVLLLIIALILLISFDTIIWIYKKLKTFIVRI